MISPRLLGIYDGRHSHPLPVNMCSHCGETDDPESARHWPDDEDGDRICNTCAEAEGLEAS